jgi:hypothetical protein
MAGRPSWGAVRSFEQSPVLPGTCLCTLDLNLPSFFLRLDTGRRWCYIAYRVPPYKPGFGLQNNATKGGAMKKLLTVAALLYWCGWYYPYWWYCYYPMYWGCWY